MEEIKKPVTKGQERSDEDFKLKMEDPAFEAMNNIAERLLERMEFFAKDNREGMQIATIVLGEVATIIKEILYNWPSRTFERHKPLADYKIQKRTEGK